MRLATYNIEWFTELFSRDNRLLLDKEWSRRYNITRADQGHAIARVLRRLDADAVFIVEAPNTGHEASTVTSLENFARHFNLRQSRAISGFPSETHQELALLYDPAVVSPRFDPQGTPSQGQHTRTAPRFDGKFLYDVDLDGTADAHVFSKPPLELEITDKASGAVFRMIGVHTKSKSTFGAKNPEDEIQMLIDNRRKQLAQCIWIRQRVDAHLAAGDPLVVLGDFNDGPSANGLEGLFARSGVEIVLGKDLTPPDRALVEPNAAIQLDPHHGWVMATARFYSGRYKRYLNALLDYVMLSQDLSRRSDAAWRIWHPFDDPECFDDGKMQQALLTASDHFPVSVDMQFSL